MGLGLNPIYYLTNVSLCLGMTVPINWHPFRMPVQRSTEVQGFPSVHITAILLPGPRSSGGRLAGRFTGHIMLAAKSQSQLCNYLSNHWTLLSSSSLNTGAPSAWLTSTFPEPRLAQSGHASTFPGDEPGVSQAAGKEHAPLCAQLAPRGRAEDHQAWPQGVPGTQSYLCLPGASCWRCLDRTRSSVSRV